MTGEQVELALPADTQYVGLARLVVTAAARGAGMTPDRVEDLKIAVSEATTSAIEAHRRNPQEGHVILRFGAAGNDAFEVTVLDAGSSFDEVPPGQRPDWTQEGDLGVVLIRELADEVEFVLGEGMQVHMNFRVGFDGSGAPVAEEER